MKDLLVRQLLKWVSYLEQLIQDHHFGAGYLPETVVSFIEQSMDTRMCLSNAAAQEYIMKMVFTFLLVSLTSTGVFMFFFCRWQNSHDSKETSATETSNTSSGEESEDATSEEDDTGSTEEKEDDEEPLECDC